MVDSSQEKITFNITSRLAELKEKEKTELQKIKDLNPCRNYVADKLSIMNELKQNENELEKFGSSVFNKEEIEAISKLEEFQRKLFCKKTYLLPLSIASTLGFMAFYKQSLSVKTFYENVHLVAPVFAGTYFIGNTLLDLGYRTRARNYEKEIQNTIQKAKLHSSCMMLTNQLKFEVDNHLE